MKNKKDAKQKKRIIASTGKGKANVKKKKVENNYTKCMQTDCGFWRNGGCQKCEECGAEPYKVTEGCQRCFDCENKPDALRWGDKADNLELSNKNKAKMKELFENAIEKLNGVSSEEIKKKMRILSNGDIEEEKPDKNDMNDFQKDLKQELIKQMAEQMIGGMPAGMPGIFKKDKKDDDEEKPKKKDVSYIGYVKNPKDTILSSFFSPYSIYKQKKQKKK